MLFKITSGLRGKLVLALLAMTSLTMVCAGVAIYTLHRSTALFDDIAMTTLPRLIIAQQLARQSERAIAEISDLFAVDSLDNKHRLEMRWNQVDRSLNATEGLRYPPVATKIDLIRIVREKLAKIISRRLETEALQREITDGLKETRRKFLSVLEPLIVIAERGEAQRDAAIPGLPSSVDEETIEPAAGPDAKDTLSLLLKLRQIASDATNVLLSVENEDRSLHLELTAIRIQSFKDRADVLLQSLDRDVSRYLTELSERFLDYGIGPRSLPILRKTILEIDAEAAGLHKTASDVAAALQASLDSLIEETSKAFEEDREHAGQRQSQMSLLVTLVAAASILTSLGVGAFYLQRHLVRPISRLSDAMRSFEINGVIPYQLTTDKDEFGHLAWTFVGMAQNRQRIQAELDEQNQLLATANGKLEHTNQELERSNQELDNFAYIAAHDLKEPLRAIQNHATFLMEDYEDQIDADGTKRLNRMVDLSGRMEKLIADLLYFARLGRGEQAMVAIDPNATITDIETSLADTLKARNASVIVANDLPPISGNPAHVTALFQNLISNGTKYNDAEEKIIEIGLAPANQEGAPDGFRTIYVRDNGIGIDDSFKNDVFKIFKRLNSEKAYGAGTGAGLSFVKKIVENHGGHIWLESEVGEGTTFFFTLREAA